MVDFFYDGQIRRYISQFIRLLSGYQVETGKDQNGNKALITVPVIYGDSSRQVANIIHNNSENNLPSTPLISVYITGLEHNREDIMNPAHYDKIIVKERCYDSHAKADRDDLLSDTNREDASNDKKSGAYTGAPGETFIVERTMPSPFKLTFNADIWTSNTQQKMQLAEQILYFWNPAMEIQTNNNYLDYTNITAAEITGINWTSRTVPAGTEEAIDVMALTFEVKIHIAPPAIIKRNGIVEKIVTGIFDGTGNLTDSVLNDITQLGDRLYYTPMNYGLILLNGTLQALEDRSPVSGQSDGINIQTRVKDENVYTTIDTPEYPYEQPINWNKVIGEYGTITNGSTRIKLLQSYNNDVFNEVVGTIMLDENDQTILHFNVDETTIPNNTVNISNGGVIDAVINPQIRAPGINLVDTKIGQTYLILDNIIGTDNKTISSTVEAWGEIVLKIEHGTKFPENPISRQYFMREDHNKLYFYDGKTWTTDFTGRRIFRLNNRTYITKNANRNDIIQFTKYSNYTSNWEIIFNSEMIKTTEYVTNIKSGIQYKWTGEEWIKSYEGVYRSGKWSILL